VTPDVVFAACDGIGTTGQAEGTHPHWSEIVPDGSTSASIQERESHSKFKK
jgi:hypothetical protein